MAGDRKRSRPTKATHVRRRIVVGIAALTVLAVIGVIAYAGISYLTLDHGVRRSQALAGTHSGHDTDLLVMGLDSRLDENGKPLPADIYRALHTGDQSTGGLNSNVLMYVHIPADGSAATAVSIPRDDYVALPGCPDKQCHAKIKEAYGLAVAQASRGATGQAAYQKSRDAGRIEEIKTVEQFLGVTINHFVEVTMVAFFQIAQVVQPITVCVKADTQDKYSGANFHAGRQQIDAAQAVAFVRQRRDTVHPDLAFTDLDRSRRQQAFIVSLLARLKATSVLLNPSKLSGIIDVAKQNMVIDAGLSPLSLATMAAHLSGSHLHFYTLPVKSFGQDAAGQSINVVDPVAIRAMVQHILNPGSAKPTASPSAAGTTVIAVNGSGRAGLARSLLTDLKTFGYATGSAGNSSRTSTSEVLYHPGETARAAQLTALLGNLPTASDPSLPPGSLKVVIGQDFSQPPAHQTTEPTAAPKAVDATGGGRSGPAPTTLTNLSGGGIPCVK
ncbi:LCP family protein [Kribbella sp. WER1]